MREMVEDLSLRLAGSSPVRSANYVAEIKGFSVDALHAAAAGGRALELDIGTGRVAARGGAVHGIKASETMLARLRAKPGGAELQKS